MEAQRQPEQPTHFGRYELLRRLAVGGMAEVFLARLVAEEGAHKPLVIKRVLPNLARNREFIERFIDEARIALPLTHDAITAVFDFGRVDDDYFIAMEHVDGPDLGTVLDRARGRGEPVPIDVALYIAAQIAAGLGYAHRAEGGGIVHRDVSPQNILLSASGAVKLTDFGIARVRSRLEFTSQLVRGKPCYMAPEQAKGEHTDGRSDLFSLGVVLHELLTGVRVFEDKTPLLTLEKVLAAPVPAPSALRPDAGTDLDAIVLKAVERDPAARYQEGRKLQADLVRLLHQRSPGFTQEQVAAYVHELFPELRRMREVDAANADPARATTVPLRERLAARLQSMDASLDAEKMTTAELLRLNTVAVPVLGPRTKTIPPPAPARPAPSVTTMAVPRDRRRIAALAVAGVALVAGTAVTMTVIGSGGGGTAATAGPSTAGTAIAGAGAGGSLDAADTAESLWTDPTGFSTAGAAPRTASLGASGLGATAAVTAAPPPIGMGTVDLVAVPWARVSVDGAFVGFSPVRRKRLRAGPHKVEFVNPMSGLAYSTTVVVKAESTQLVSVDLEVVGKPLPKGAEGDGR